MSTIRTLGAALAVKGTPTPAYLAAAYYTSTNLATPGVVLAVASFSILNNIATVVLTPALPTNGVNGPNGFIPTPVWTPASATQEFNSLTGAPVNIQGVFPAPNGQKIVLWGFGTGTYFNGKTVTVIDNNPLTKSFRFYFTHANVTSTADATGLAAPIPKQSYRAIRFECGQSLGSDIIYLGDLNVSSTQYMAALSLSGQAAIMIAGDNLRAEEFFIDTSGTSASDVVQVSVIY